LLKVGVVNVTFGKKKEVEEVFIKTYFENNFRCSGKSLDLFQTVW
jgi:hypothetical protein